VVGDPALGLTVRSDDARGMGDVTMRWTPDDRIWMRWAEGGRGRLGWVEAASGALVPAIGGDRTVLVFDLTAAGDEVAFVASAPHDPGELAVAAVDGTAERRLTHRSAWLGGVDLGTVEPIHATATDGTTLEAWLTLPPATRRGDRSPVVVSVHGGPHYSVGWRFTFEALRLAARGYAVVAGNARGSGGYGDTFATAIHGDWGGQDHLDTQALIDAALERPELDPGRLAITGVSYGGYHTLWAITRTDRFRAAISENGISDLLSSYASGSDDGSFWPEQLGGMPWEVPAEYVERSPLRHADRIHTPLLLIHAELDQGCTIAQSEQLFVALRGLGRTVRMVRAPGEGHLMNLHGSARFRLARAAAIDDWLDRFLGP
jgi:dipeptidyl aminopeptidase/acylaminoacyl peptidase